MKLLLFVFAFFLSLVASVSQAAIRPYYQDVKFPTQVMLEHQDIVNPAAAGTENILDDSAGGTGTGASAYASFVAQPDVPRNLVLTPGGSTADIKACTVVVTGTDYIGGAISENFVMGSTQSTAITGSQAFNTVTSVVFPADCEGLVETFDATFDLGWGEKLGLKRCLANAGDLAWSTVAGAYEATRPTVAVDDDEVSKNTADFNGTMNGSNDFQAFFIQNFNAGCQP